MSLLERWNPSRDLERFRHEVDDLLEKFGFERGASLKDWESFATFRPAIESYVDGDKFTVRMELPGIDPKKVDIKVTGGVLTVRARASKRAKPGRMISIAARFGTDRSSGRFRCRRE